MKPQSKWISGISGKTLVGKASRISLHQRLNAVWDYLPLAARHADQDDEYIHQLRVQTRRSLAAIQLYQRLLPAKQTKWFCRRLKQIRRAAGEARDMDVLASNTEINAGKVGDVISARLSRHREDAQVPVVTLYKKLARGDHWQQRLKKLTDRRGDKTAKIARRQFQFWAAKRLSRMVREFFRASPGDFSNISRLHTFRIRGKELRYGIELLAPAFPRRLKEQLYPVVEEIQERIGIVNDCDVARVRLLNWAAESEEVAERDRLSILADQQQQRLDVSLSGFAAWWTPALQKKTRRRFKHLIRNSEQRR